MADKYGSYYNNGSYDVFRAAIRYEVTSTSETAYTIRCRSWIQTGEFHDDGSNFQGRAYITNSYSSWVPGSGYLNAGDESGWLGDITKTITRTHSAQTITCSGQGWSSYFDAYTPWVNATVTVPAKASYKVTYNANGGSGAPSAQTKWYGEALTLSSTKPTRTGYTFGGWNTKSDGSGTNYSAGGSYTGNAAVTLYAKWTAITYTVAYNANSGSGTMASQTKTYGVTLTLRTNAFTRTGYDFVRFNTKSDGSGTNYPSGGSYSANAAATMYAQWSIKTYSVTYNANKPSAATGTVGNLPSSQTKTYGATLKLSTAVPTLSGYTFKGWATTSTATTAAYSAGGNYTANAAATLYAVWQVAAPSLTIVSAYRADSSGDPVDEGTYASVTISAVSQTGAELTFSVTVNDITVASPTTSLAPKYTFLIANGTPSTDSAYAVSVTVSDTNGSTTRTAVIQTAWYAIDIRRGGHGIAFGKVASQDGLADFGMGVNVDGIVKASQRFVSESGTANSLMRFLASRTDTGNSLWFGISWGGIDRGIWDNGANRWMLCINSDGENVYGGTPHKTTSTITVSNCTAATNVCWKNGVMAGFTLTISTLASALASGSYRNIGTLPSGYRPTLAVRFPVGGANKATFAGKVFLQVNPNGNIYLFNWSGSSLGTDVAMYFSDTYPI